MVYSQLLEESRCRQSSYSLPSLLYEQVGRRWIATDFVSDGLVRGDLSLCATSWACLVMQTGKCPFQPRAHTYSTNDVCTSLRYDLLVGFDVINASLDALPIRKKDVKVSG
jgi:hypothetical protein